MSGRKPDKSGGVILALAENRARLDEILAADPFWREAIAKYKVGRSLAHWWRRRAGRTPHMGYVADQHCARG